MVFAVLMFGEPGAEIIYPNPVFPIYQIVIEFSGATPVPMPLHEAKGFSFSADEVLARITPRTRLIILNCPPTRPAAWCRKREIDTLVAGLEHHPDVAVMSRRDLRRMIYDGVPHASAC